MRGRDSYGKEGLYTFTERLSLRIMMIIFYTFTERLLGSKSPVSPAWLEDFRACFVVKAYFHNLDFVISHSLYYAGIWSH